MFQFPLYNPYTPVLLIVQLFGVKMQAFEALLNGRTWEQLTDQDEIVLGMGLACELDTLEDVAQMFGFKEELVRLTRNGRAPAESYKLLTAKEDAAKVYDSKIDSNPNIKILIESLQKGNDELDELTGSSEDSEQAA